MKKIILLFALIGEPLPVKVGLHIEPPFPPFPFKQQGFIGYSPKGE